MAKKRNEIETALDKMNKKEQDIIYRLTDVRILLANKKRGSQKDKIEKAAEMIADIRTDVMKMFIK